MRLSKSNMRPLLFFYLLVVYVTLQFCWWAYLLVELNTEVYQYKMEIVELKHTDPLKRNADQEAFEKNLHKRWVMVTGEGIVFIALLIVGINQTRRSFRKEFMLTRQQKNFLLSITHEFKSPLAAIKLSLQTLHKHHLDEEKQQALIRRSLNETDRIQNLIENALTAAQIESQNIELQNEEFNLSALITGIVNDKTLHVQSSHQLTTVIPENVYMKGDALAINSVILNLLENAEKYSPENSIIQVELAEREKYIVLRVKDNGTGIPEEEKEHIFDKFYRIGNEDTRKSKGTGLGLYIVKNIVALQKGKVFVKDNHPQGTIFEIIFQK
ncbi:MAG: sensor histidine kinase [Bacteroidia bacterium]